ncbi:interferon regulatory factor 8 [Leucoraja erinacea]|uniref:interferon regulatory factor 8 n=1 Tax=Leucoraja erinaceus TaxID=7782 RepID=UPI00245733D4|nr:interferon regulatory factor 8 [Leucoraja erinacea]
MQGIGMVDKNSSGMRRLKQWLIDQIDSDQYPGLVWDDDQRITFRIPWKHAGKQDYNQEVDASIFKAWAVFKGKYKEGEKAEPATWKTRLRCALNKSPDFEEVTDRSQLDISEPYKVYRIVPEGQQKCKFGNLSNEQGDITDMDCSPPGSDELMKEVIADYNGIIKRSHSPPEEDCTNQPQIDWWGRQNIEDSSMLYYGNNYAPMQPNSGFCQMMATFYYGGIPMSRIPIRRSDGCRITVRHAPITSEGLESMEQVLFPPTNKIANPRQQQVTNKLLTHLERGVLLLSNNEGIYIKRLCQGRVFWSGPCAPYADRPNKLERDAIVKLFDTKQFLQALQLYTENPQCIPPNNKVIICFGEEFPDMKPMNKKLIIVEIEQMKSKQILQAVLQAKNYENINLQISTESAEEKLILHELCMNSYGYPRPAFSENQQIS